MPVLQAEHKLPLEPDFFYIIPPGKEVIVEDGLLKITARPEQGFDHMPINRLFNSLAENYKEYSIGVVLSGADSDRAIGAKYIKMAGGLAFAQNDTALFSSMPKAAIAEGAIDLLLLPKEIAEEIKSLSKQKETYYLALQEWKGDHISNKDEELLSIL